MRRVVLLALVALTASCGPRPGVCQYTSCRSKPDVRCGVCVDLTLSNGFAQCTDGKVWDSASLLAIAQYCD